MSNIRWYTLTQKYTHGSIRGKHYCASLYMQNGLVFLHTYGHSIMDLVSDVFLTREQATKLLYGWRYLINTRPDFELEKCFESTEVEA